MYAWAILFYAILWHEKRRKSDEERKELLIFTLFCLFLLFHFLLIASAPSSRAKSRAKDSAHSFKIFADTRDKLCSRDENRSWKLSRSPRGNDFYVNQGRHSFAFCRPQRTYNDNKLYLWKPCRELLSLSRDLFDLYHPKSQRSLEKQSIIFRSHSFSNDVTWWHTPPRLPIPQWSHQFRNVSKESPNDDQCNQSESGNKTGVYASRCGCVCDIFCALRKSLTLKEFQLRRLGFASLFSQFN